VFFFAKRKTLGKDGAVQWLRSKVRERDLRFEYQLRQNCEFCRKNAEKKVEVLADSSPPPKRIFYFFGVFSF